MPVIDFPSNPSNNELFIAQGKAMRYNSDKNKWKQVTTLTQSQVTSLENNTIGVAAMTVSGNTLVIQKDDSTHANVSLAAFAGNILTNYASASQLPLTGLVSGTQVYVTDTDSLFITDGNGWFKVATVNLSPSLSLGVSSISLNAGGSVDVNYTVTEPEDTPFTISASATNNATVTVHQSNNTITFDTPVAATTETITITASDGVNTVGDTLTMTITLGPDWSTGTQQARIQATSPINNSNYGKGVAIDGDYAVVGAPDADFDGLNNNGIAYIWIRSGSTWTQQAVLINPTQSSNDRYGHSVAIQGNTVAISIERDDGIVTDSGAIDIWTRSGTSWTRTQRIKESSPENTAYSFGSQIHMFGNYLIVGKHRADNPTDKEGEAIIFYNDGSSWTQQQVIEASDKQVDDMFGISVGIDENYAIVGAYQHDAGGNSYDEFGAAYIFSRSGTTWSQQAKLTPSGATPNDKFGTQVAISGDYAVVTAPNRNTNGNFGLVYVFKRSGSSWSQYQILQPSVDLTTGIFAQSVDIQGTVIAVGAQDANNTNVNGVPYDRMGAVYVWQLQNGVWTEVKILGPSDTAANSGFGADGLHGNIINIDRAENQIIVGARKAAGNIAGAAYIFTA